MARRLLPWEINTRSIRNVPNLDQALVQAAQQALEQIELQHYVAEAKQHDRINILKIGLAFSGKQFKLLSQQL